MTVFQVSRPKIIKNSISIKVDLNKEYPKMPSVLTRQIDEYIQTTYGATPSNKKLKNPNGWSPTSEDERKKVGLIRISSTSPPIGEGRKQNALRTTLAAYEKKEPNTWCMQDFAKSYYFEFKGKATSRGVGSICVMLDKLLGGTAFERV